MRLNVFLGLRKDIGLSLGANSRSPLPYSLRDDDGQKLPEVLVCQDEASGNSSRHQCMRAIQVS